VFAQIASSFGLLIEVDWATLFKTFYEVVRVKISCKDPMKIPTDRLFEMNKKIFLVSFLVEREVEKELKSKGTDDGGGDDDNLDNDDEADDLDDDDGVEKPPTTKFQAGESSKMKTPTIKPSANSGCKTVNAEVNMIEMDQELQLMSLMRGLEPKLLTAGQTLTLGSLGFIDENCGQTLQDT